MDLKVTNTGTIHLDNAERRTFIDRFAGLWLASTVLTTVLVVWDLNFYTVLACVASAELGGIWWTLANRRRRY